MTCKYTQYEGIRLPLNEDPIYIRWRGVGPEASRRAFPARIRSASLFVWITARAAVSSLTSNNS